MLAAPEGARRRKHTGGDFGTCGGEMRRRNEAAIAVVGTPAHWARRHGGGYEPQMKGLSEKLDPFEGGLMQEFCYAL
jgi:hypothetical protein